MLHHPSSCNVCLLCFLLWCWFPDQTAASFTPNDGAELKIAVDKCLLETPGGTCPTFAGTNSNGIIGEWDTSKVTDMTDMFVSLGNVCNSGQDGDQIESSTWPELQTGECAVAHSFNQDISKWNVTRVTKMKRMFLLATAFNGDLSKWVTSKVTDMTSVFSKATVFDGCNGNVAQCDNGLQNWDVSRVSSMFGLFYRAKAFNNDLSTWKTTNVKSINDMFSGASAFNGDISTWVSHGVVLAWTSTKNVASMCF